MHQVWMEPGSAVAQAMGSRVVEVSSYHHQAVDRLGAGLRVVGRADDGCIEVLEHEHAPMLGVQWHPEDNADTAAHQQALFDATVERARLARARRDECGRDLVRTKEN
jgi:putative glutamine amidotransferase